MKAPTVLVVEDNPGIRAMIRSTLGAAGYRIIEADDGAGALRKMRRRRPGLVLLGTLLPDAEGFELVDRLRRLPGGVGVAIVAIAECQCPACQRLLVATDFTDYLYTPLDPARLLSVVRLYLPAEQLAPRSDRT